MSIVIRYTAIDRSIKISMIIIVNNVGYFDYPSDFESLEADVSSVIAVEISLCNHESILLNYYRVYERLSN